MPTRLALVTALLLSGLVTPLPADEPPRAEKFLLDGNLAVGITALDARLAAHADDDQARFGLGVLQFMRAVERLGQSVHKYGGLGSQNRLARVLPFVRLPVPENPDPAEVSYADVRGMIEAFLSDVAAAEKTLAAIKDDKVVLPLKFGLVRLDLDGDGKAGESEALWRLMAALGQRPGQEPDPEVRKQAEAFVIRADRGDAYWLQGYCHLLSALGEYALAHDTEAFFNVLAPNVFAKPKVRELPEDMFGGKAIEFFGDVNPIADAIAAIHEWRFEVVAPARTAAALAHLEAVTRISRLSWKAIEAETDDDHEWIPNAKQSSVVPGMQVTAEMLGGWQEFLDEADAILAGKRLVPHWRLAAGYGINFRRVFLEPKKMDLVRWLQGAAIVPYVEKGECTDPETWQRIERAFGGQFIGFAIWFN